MKRQSALSVIILFSGIVNAQGQDYVVNCNPLLFPQQTLSNDTQNLDISADHSQGNHGNYLLTGDASVNSSEYYLAADKINLQKNTKTSEASGNVRFQNKRIMLTANKATVKKQGTKTHSVFEQTKFHYPQNKLNGQAQKITNDGNKQTLDSVSYTLCPIGNTDWVMKATKMTFDSEANQGVAKDVTIELMGVPIFYYPHYEWKLKGRSSGFLAPMLAIFDDSGNGKNGYQIRIPYYFNIAPDRDFLLTLNQVSTRGQVIEGKYRQLIDNQLTNNGRIEIEGHYLDKDKVSKERRWYFDTKLNLSLNDKTKFNIITKRASDPQYFKEISHDNTSATELTSSANLAYNNKEKNLDISIFTESEQLLGRRYDKKDAQYTKSPEISINKKVEGLDGRKVNFSIVNTKFKTKNLSEETGTRTHAQALFTRDIKTNAYSIQPKFEISKTKYAMDGTTNEDRSIYNFGIDAQLFFERNTHLFGKNLTQTLTPRLAYNYTPYKNQDALPKFDSEEITNSYEGLFSGREYAGLDRINKMNDVTFGLESDFIDQKTGETYLTLKVAQAYYLNKKNNKDYSNIITGADFSMGKLTFNNSLEYDTDTNKVEKHYNTLNYTSNARKFITLTHGDDGEKKSVDLYYTSPFITDKTHVFAGANRSLTDSMNIKKTVGITYESCCWAVRVAHFKEITDTGKADRVTKFEFTLKNLASTDASLTAHLKENIPNYLGNLE